ncbi:cytochrome P450 [Luteimonas sp. JM171]|uniref:cytochrome P450 n=1 Tax=Luteimonas sp. JM171 TaxID=1896164 RepID=UPI0012F9C6A1|nr:cytochrome P450 [Luteimonas sp. JM171]
MDEQLAKERVVSPVGKRRYILADPVVARGVLQNKEGWYEDHSDFFHTRHGLFRPREAQFTIRRDARRLLREYLHSRGESDLADHIATHLPKMSFWPDEGNRLAYSYLKPFLAATETPAGLYLLMDEIVERAVLANAKRKQRLWRRMLLQFRTTLLLSEAFEDRRRTPQSPPVDVLDVIANASNLDHGVDELSEIFLSFLFASAGSVGFLLAWSIYLRGTNSPRNVPADWVVRESLRLWPVAWLLSRKPAEPHTVAGVSVERHEDVVVCPYSVQRNPHYWSSPSEFRPERWADESEWSNPAFIPFGHGRHRCVAADLVSDLVSSMLKILDERFTLHVQAASCEPTVAAAMAPPPFTLELRSRP